MISKRQFSRKNLEDLTELTRGQLQYLEAKKIFVSPKTVYTCRYGWNDVLIARIIKQCFEIGITAQTINKFGQKLQGVSVLDHDFAVLTERGIGFIKATPQPNDDAPVYTFVTTPDGGVDSLTPIIAIAKMNRELLKKARELDLIEETSELAIA